MKLEEEARPIKEEARAALELARERVKQVERRSERMLKEAMEGDLSIVAHFFFIGAVVVSVGYHEGLKNWSTAWGTRRTKWGRPKSELTPDVGHHGSVDDLRESRSADTPHAASIIVFAWQAVFSHLSMDTQPRRSTLLRFTSTSMAAIALALQSLPPSSSPPTHTSPLVIVFRRIRRILGKG